MGEKNIVSAFAPKPKGAKVSPVCRERVQGVRSSWVKVVCRVGWSMREFLWALGCTRFVVEVLHGV